MINQHLLMKKRSEGAEILLKSVVKGIYEKKGLNVKPKGPQDMKEGVRSVLQITITK